MVFFNTRAGWMRILLSIAGSAPEGKLPGADIAPGSPSGTDNGNADRVISREAESALTSS